MSPFSAQAVWATATATALAHTLIPDHWLPFVLIGRARGWSVAYTAAVSGLSAAIHVGLSVALGLVALGVGGGLARAVGGGLEQANPWLLVLFGVGYALWAWRKGAHFHPGGRLLHRDEPGTACPGGEAGDHSQHLHYHADDRLIRGDSVRGALALAAIVGANPCVVLLPLLLTSAASGTAALARVALAYALPTVALMIGLSVLGVSASRRLYVPLAARHMEAASGVLIALLGAVLAAAR
ncbi:MAG TPA: hypothetical protein VJS92_14605 [Candidatus Polarisedimenticolaceae bacterium]|nr:hypothetical protein [Candidatus Polarisedimenticolaceae bacterium]